MKQYTNHIIIIKPINFQYNSENAVNNFYQKNSAVITEEDIQYMALDEFNNLVKKLEEHSVKVTVFNDVILATVFLTVLGISRIFKSRKISSPKSENFFKPSFPQIANNSLVILSPAASFFTLLATSIALS